MAERKPTVIQLILRDYSNLESISPKRIKQQMTLRVFAVTHLKILDFVECHCY